MKNYLFAKNFQEYSIAEVMQYCRKIGVDGPTLLIRDGFWVDDNNIFEMAPKFINCAVNNRLEVKYADTSFQMSDMAKNEDKLKLLRDSGIEQFRVCHIPKTVKPAKELDGYLRDLMSSTCEICSKIGIKAVVQIHGVMYPHNATATYFCIKGLDPEYIGVKLDPGNNYAFEGYELFDYQIDLLSDYISAIGLKDAGMVRNDNSERDAKGWARTFLPSYEGISDYDFIFANLKKFNLDIPGVLMPFYTAKDDEEFIEKLKKEVEYFKRAQQEAGL